MTTLLYDGSFEGFLTCVFEVYAQKHLDARIRKQATGDCSLWGDTVMVATDQEKASRVWDGLKKRSSAGASHAFYCSFLSELPDEEDNMLAYLRYVFASEEDISKDFSTPSVLRVAKVAKMVGREKHRMEAFVRFELMDNAVWCATIEPDFNVLPLISKHFKNRYANQKWLIGDVKRQYALYYDTDEVSLIEYRKDKNAKTLGEGEKAYQSLWKTYFKRTNIKERRNLKLHLQHVPTRYWKYLSEKHPAF